MWYKFLLVLLGTAAITEQRNEEDPNALLDGYFHAVTTHDANNILYFFAADAVVQTYEKTYYGHDEIKQFYETGLLRCHDFFPLPGPRYQNQDGIAVEIILNCDGSQKMVGDFFSFKNGKISRLNVYSGPHMS